MQAIRFGRTSVRWVTVPGIAEEAYFSCLYGKPLYLSGVIGGVTAQIVAAFEGQQAEIAFALPEPVAEPYSKAGLAEPSTRTDHGGVLPSAWLLDYFREFGIERLSQINLLSPDENRALFHPATIDGAQDLILRGLLRLAAER